MVAPSHVAAVSLNPQAMDPLRTAGPQVLLQLQLQSLSPGGKEKIVTACTKVFHPD